MRTIEKTIYNYDELPTEAAKDKSREWYRETGLNYEWWDSVYEDAAELFSAIGFTNVDIRFSGFCQQGDGASFSARYGFAPEWRNAMADIAPRESEVAAVAESLDAIQRRYGGRLVANVETDRYGRGSYCHEGTMAATLHDEGGDCDVPEADEAEFLELARRLARWIYRRLEAEWDSINDDECVASVIVDNEYEFFADGSRCRE